MTDTTTGRQTFEIVRRGYEPQQVDRRVAALVSELEQTRKRSADLERRVEELHLQSQQMQDEAEGSVPAYAGLGTRIEQILTLAEQEASELRSAAVEEADQHRALTDQDATKIRNEADRYSRERRSEVDAEVGKVLEEARRQADQLRDEAERETKARREEAEALFERNRAKAAQAAADFESTLAHRR
jgi:cell division septum initiation protein DivIVA